MTHCPSAIKSQHAGAWRNRRSGLLAVLPGVPTAVPAVPKNRTQGLPTLTRHQQKANEQCWKPRAGEQARSTLPAPLVAPVSHTLSRGLSHRGKGSTSPGSWHSQSLTKLESQQRVCTKATLPQKAQMRRSWFEQSNPLPGCVLIPLAQMEKQEKQERSSDDGLNRDRSMFLQHVLCQPLPKAPAAQMNVKYRQTPWDPTSLVPTPAFSNAGKLPSSHFQVHTHMHPALAALASIHTVASSLDCIQFLERSSGRANFQCYMLPAQGHRALPVGEGTG